MVVAGLLGLLGPVTLSAQEKRSGEAVDLGFRDGSLVPYPSAEPGLPAPATANAASANATPEWQTAWGLVGLRAIPADLRVAPNGLEYHPNFSLDLNFNIWIWRTQGLYLFADARLWGQKNEFGVTNANDGIFATSKREFDLSGGAAWNYAGPWELRAFGYSYSNLNRGDNPVTPAGFSDGFGLENRYYLSREYASLGQAGFDVTKASFLSFGYLPSKVMVGNDGQQFEPGMTLRAYLTYDVRNWPCYLFADAQYISERSFEPRLLLFDVGVAVRPFHNYQQWEFRVGTENTADVQAHKLNNLWYLSLRFIY
jgi:hypothetical protein